MGLTRDQILAVSDIQTEEVHVPEWDGTVLVRGLTGAERDEFETGIAEPRASGVRFHMKDIRARLCVMSIVDGAGHRMFTLADVEALTCKSASALDRVFTVARRLSGLSTADVEELAKNSESGPSAASGSD